MLIDQTHCETYPNLFRIPHLMLCDTLSSIQIYIIISIVCIFMYCIISLSLNLPDVVQK